MRESERGGSCGGPSEWRWFSCSMIISFSRTCCKSIPKRREYQLETSLRPTFRAFASSSTLSSVSQLGFPFTLTAIQCVCCLFWFYRISFLEIYVEFSPLSLHAALSDLNGCCWCCRCMQNENFSVSEFLFASDMSQRVSFSHTFIIKLILVSVVVVVVISNSSSRFNTLSREVQMWSK